MKEKQKILLFIANEYEDLELQYPRLRLLEAGKEVFVAGETTDAIYQGKHGYPQKADISFEDVNVNEFTALVIPGGYAPDKLRTNEKVLTITREFHRQKKLIAFICHAGWIPISAKILEGVKCTSYAAIKDDMINAGAQWCDEAVAVDQHFISSRFPDDLPKFCPAILEFLSKKK